MAKQSKGIPTALLAVVIAIAAYWYWSPLLVVHQMKEAVRVHDVEAFNSHVDFPALRENMKDDIAGKPNDDALSGFGRLLGGVVVDALVRPEAVMLVLEHGDFAKKRKDRHEDRDAREQERERDDEPPSGEKRPKWVTERDGVNRYIVRNDKIALVFVRNGFADWKLSEFRL
ncbi:DUF2939 domain-containing protein [Duganella sp. Root1480D1]|uniref:DUF2939 domain-containing protein n=1 Tax=Duganella sp. Root1480D1 TaxID=1736471 RepID=UPI000708A624|nr:DUF2939 domain-containing protein [Duganella sp. Root1480D1]KQZ26250.1 hypothetical protein ASD58_16535 [Duganella sp. Root1480D1]